ncbi:LytR/AlgR family response regulator transcription factor [Aquimarina hainanensis]|uniref:LytR/AlgR family response regulator transcription factor n=1 Tax=Aquimarina hainanensis TaxID=1578017 RepID=A0ABW5N363_9FLAO
MNTNVLFRFPARLLYDFFDKRKNCDLFLRELFKWYLFLGTLFVGTTNMFGKQQADQTFIEINNAADTINIFRRLSFYVEKGNQEFDRKRLEHAEFTIPDRLYYYLPMKVETLWMRCTIRNNTQNDLLYYFILRHAYLYKGTVFLLTKDKVTELHTHSYQNIKKNHRFSNFPTWKIPIPKHGEIQVYIKVHETGGRTRISSLLKSEKQFFSYLIKSFSIHAVFIFFILLIVFLSVYIVRYTGKRYVLFYTFYVLFLAMDYLAVHGIGQSYIWTDSYFLLRNVRSMSNASSALFLCLFFAFFYNQFSYPRWIKKTFIVAAIVFGIFLSLYGIKLFFGGLRSLFLYVWKSISLLSILLIVIHTYLAFRKKIPFYLPLVFIIHTVITFVNANYIFPYSNHIVIDWILVNIYYLSLSLEIIVWVYFIFKTLKSEKLLLQKLKTEVGVLQEKLDTLKSQYNKNEKSQINELIHLKSKAVLNSIEILYIKSDGHYVEYYTEHKKNPEIDRNSLTEVLKQLPSSSFIRVHKSYIVNIYRIKIINSTKLMLDNGVWLNLSRTYKQQLKDILNHGG